jgi:hypothetical protein
MVAVAGPIGEFPLNDDWSYSRAVHTLITHGRFELSDFTAMPLLTQMAWGALFCLPFGFSFTALRLSTVVLGLAGIIGTYALLRVFDVHRRMVLLGALLLVVNPLYFVLSLTYMTDVPFVALSSVSLACIASGVRNRSSARLAVGFAVAAGALLIRQLAIAIPLAFATAWLASVGLSRRSLLVAGAPVVGGLAILGGYQLMLRITVGVPVLYNRSYDPILEAAAGDVFAAPGILVWRFLVQVLWIGLFTLPLSVVVAAVRWRAGDAHQRRIAIAAGLVLICVLVAAVRVPANATLLVGNVIFDFGVGPPLLRDSYLLQLPHLPKAPQAFWLAVTAMAILGAALLVLHVVGSVSHLGWPWYQRDQFHVVLVIAAASFYVGAGGIAGFLDRYLIWLLPPLMASIVAAAPRPAIAPPRSATWLAGLLLVATGLFSLAGTHDYMAWNRVRWGALADLTEGLGVPSSHIDGGFEFNGWYTYDRGYKQREGVSWWWVGSDDYVLSFGPVEGFTVFRQYPYPRWLTTGQGVILVLRKDGVAGNP